MPCGTAFVAKTGSSDARTSARAWKSADIIGSLHVKALKYFDGIASDARDASCRASLAPGKVGGAACVEPKARWAAYRHATNAVMAFHARDAYAAKFLFAWRTCCRSVGIEDVGGGAEVSPFGI